MCYYVLIYLPVVFQVRVVVVSQYLIRNLEMFPGQKGYVTLLSSSGFAPGSLVGHVQNISTVHRGKHRDRVLEQPPKQLLYFKPSLDTGAPKAQS